MPFAPFKSVSINGHGVGVAVLFAALLAVLAAPFLLRRPGELAPAGARSIIVLSPHNEAVRYEFERAFSAWHEMEYGEPVDMDWRSIGGTSEIVRYMDGEFEAAGKAGRAGIGVDLFFGGGQYDHAQQADKGHTVPCGLSDRHPEWLAGTIITQSFSGERYYDPGDRWYGACLSGFGLCYNTDVLAGPGMPPAPRAWADLARPEFRGRLALADPAKSGSINKAFEMVIQERMTAHVLAQGRALDQATPDDLATGWRNALCLVRALGANARYFTDSAGKVPLDVAQGNAAAGMCIDFYGRFESEAVFNAEGSSRMQYLTPGGSSISVDPIAILKGAPNRVLAERFVDFVLSEKGQRLWNYRVGEPGGPVRYALRRLPVRKDLYTAAHRGHMSDPDVMPYEQNKDFIYMSAWTAPLFGFMRMLIRSECIDTHDELVRAWRAIIEAGGPDACPEAMRAFDALPPNAEYGEARATAKKMKDTLLEAAITRDWVVFFRAQYREAESLARESRKAGRQRPF